MEKKKDFESFLKTLTGLGELFDKKISDTLFELYWQTLNDLSFADFKRAANQLALTTKFFPKPVEFREQVLPDIATQAALAYAQVERAFTCAGVYASVVFDDPVIHAVLDNLGGWIEYCNQPEDNVKWWRKDFERRYQEFAPLVKTGMIKPPAMLGGLYAADPQSSERARLPVFVGDRQKALAWTEVVKKEKALELEGAKKLEAAVPQMQGICKRA